MSGTIVVGVDGSEGGKAALAWAIEEARIRGARLRALLAWSYLDQPVTDFDPQFGEENARERLEEVIAEVTSGADSGVEIERVVVCDLAARALLEATAGADLVVVGSRGMGGFKGLLLGSVSQQIAHHATCPVVIIPGPERTAH